MRKLYGINITRINRAGVDLVAKPNLSLQVGDRVNVVGTETAVSNVEKVLGNSMKRLNEPNLITIFVGIALGIILGSIPFTFPGIPQPVKLGLAGFGRWSVGCRYPDQPFRLSLQADYLYNTKCQPDAS